MCVCVWERERVMEKVFRFDRDWLYVFKHSIAFVSCSLNWDWDMIANIISISVGFNIMLLHPLLLSWFLYNIYICWWNILKWNNDTYIRWWFFFCHHHNYYWLRRMPSIRHLAGHNNIWIYEYTNKARSENKNIGKCSLHQYSLWKFVGWRFDSAFGGHML